MPAGWLSLLLLGAAHAGGQSTVTVDTSATLHTLPSTFLSFTVDSGQLFPGVFWNHSKAIDFHDATLALLTSALSPALLRVGGTDADRIFYDLHESHAAVPPPTGYTYTLTRDKLSELFEFAKTTGMRVVFGLNGGPGPRYQDGRWNGAWTSHNARLLVNYTCSHFPGTVAAWELGNEPNLYLANFEFVLHSQQLVSDLRALRGMLGAFNCSSSVVGPDVAEQILPGVVGHLPPSIQEFLDAGGASVVDAISYHWYPLDGLESTRRVDPWYATVARATSLETLNRGVALATRVKAQVGNSSAIWTGETALAAFGGQAQVSQTWAGVFFWADALGSAARLGQQAIVRQTLCGARYSLLDPKSDCKVPHPDYWVALLWKRLMHARVLSATSSVAHIRAYAGLAEKEDGVGSVAVMILNLGNSTANVALRLHGRAASIADGAVQVYLLAPFESKDGLETQRTLLNGVELVMGRTGQLPAIAPKLSDPTELALTPYSVAFVVSA